MVYRCSLTYRKSTTLTENCLCIYKMPAKKYFFLIFILLAVLLAQNGQAYAGSNSKLHIAIFREEGFPATDLPKNLSTEWLKKNLQAQGYGVSYFDTSQLLNNSLFNSNKVDLLMLPYGETFPIDAFNAIKNYLQDGGGLFTVAGRPFWLPVKKVNDKWETVAAKPYEDFLAKLGIKYYQSEDTPSSSEFNEELFKGLSGNQLFTKADIGVTVTTSDKSVKMNPTHGNVFPFRIPCRDFMPILKSLNKSGEVLTYPAILVKSWRNPYRKENKVPNKWCLIAIKGEKHPLNPKYPYAKKVLENLMGYLSSKISLHSLETNYACYYQRETVKSKVKALNYGVEDKIIQINFIVKDRKNRIIYRTTKKVDLLAGTEVTIGDIWKPKIFFDDFYIVEASIRDKGKFIDKEKTGFVVWDDKILKKGEPLRVEGKNFFAGNKKIFLSGTNYYESKLGELMWLHPDMFNVKEDFEKMQKMGINFVRIHYHHSKWFRDYITKIAKLSLTEYFDVSDNTPLPSERSLRIIDAIIQLAQKHNLIFCMDIFSLVPEEIGDPRGWLGFTERMIDSHKVALQQEFARILAKRYKDVPGITWDLWNEPRLEKIEDMNKLKDWAAQLMRVFRENGDNHPITIGDDLSLKLIDILDYASVHTYGPEEFNPPIRLNKPFIFQEVWNDVGCSLEDEIKQAKKLKKDFYSALGKGASGFAPWQWTRQARLWNDTNQPEQWDDELGIFTHDDGTLKPAGRVYSLLINELKQ